MCKFCKFSESYNGTTNAEEREKIAILITTHLMPIVDKFSGEMVDCARSGNKYLLSSDSGMDTTIKVCLASASNLVLTRDNNKVHPSMQKIMDEIRNKFSDVPKDMFLINDDGTVRPNESGYVYTSGVVTKSYINIICVVVNEALDSSNKLIEEAMKFLSKDSSQVRSQDDTKMSPELQEALDRLSKYFDER